MLSQKIFSIAQTGSEYILWVLIILSVLSIAFIIERFIFLRKIKAKSAKINARIEQNLQENNISDIEEMAKDRDSLEGRAISYGLRNIEKHGVDGVEEIINTFALNEKPKLEKHLSLLATIGSNAPFIGLLGTVLEIMQSISSIGADQGNISGVIVGIAGALVATAVGLFVAIPAVIAYNYFQGQVKGILQNIEMVKELCLTYAKQITNI